MRSLSWLLLLCACGVDKHQDTRFLSLGFKTHALACTVPNLQAKLQISGAPDCALTLDANQIAEGSCEGVPTGGVLALRLVYFVTLQNTIVELGVVRTTVDVSNPSSDTVRVDLGSQAPNTDGDDDNDGVTNVVEICMGRDPLAT